ncbi:hypothetical protein PEX1_035780 [Penicillium expansum]|uniref:F-box domain-containing protein n=1 Tax=Penicillium expansum TaxID=27334 RepID=A0A0A2KSI9_PENEN|nr:hypothetical protein PEX2_001780 [Penicillium expansum]KGO48681.1 hypothetical protein PEXP_074110 [Penicillium expansum]KGO57204.1 hypothetical protein PEX2_001780 [Penicillium expansum]KGO67325.1 hypothetical protein PEX1_035780 [Penicillium expansum]
MNRLPPELLHQICLSLHADGLDSRTTLSIFSRLNHTCYGIAAPLVYQHLSVIFWDRQTLRETVSELTEEGLGRQFVKYARKLSIICLDPYTGNSPRARSGQLEGYKLGLSRDVEGDLAAKNTFLESHLTDPSLCRAAAFDLLTSWSSYRKSQRDWDPLATLIARLYHLGQIDFLVQDNFPISLQEAISQHHPNCLLNLWSSQNVSTSVPGLKKLANPQLWEQIADDNPVIDVNLLRLQGLHTFAVQIPGKSDGNSGRIELDEMLPFLFLAPNLKHLLLEDPTRHRLPMDMLKEEWHKFAVTMQPVPISSLQSISIGRPGPYEDILLKLANIVDLSQLRSLQINATHDTAVLTRVPALFPNLERLFISTNGYGWGRPSLSTDDDIGIAAIRAFNPLKYLYLDGFRSVSSLNQILQRHGLSLKGLIVIPCIQPMNRPDEAHFRYNYPELDAFDISQLAKSCPQLEELRIPIKRSMGSQEECEMYKALGNFSSLRSLVLDLHFDPRSRPVYRIEQVEASVLQEIFVNATMDEKLALQIWHLISSNQASRRLQHLRVAPFGHESLPRDEIRLLDWCSPTKEVKGEIDKVIIYLGI